MATQKIKIAIAGATGETGLSIINALLEHQEYVVTAFIRPSSLESVRAQAVKATGVPIVPFDYDAPVEDLVKAIQGHDIVVSCIIPFASDLEKKLATAAKEANVKRFVPSFFAPCSAPTGVSKLREVKEEVLNHVKWLHLPYTAIDTGGWYQVSLPQVKKLEHFIKFPQNLQYDDGHYPTAIIDLVDVGKYVALILKDPRTLNKLVFVHGEVWTQDQIFNLVEELSGEVPERQILTTEEARKAVEDAKAAYAQEQSQKNLLNLIVPQYADMIWIRGDNLPEFAAYLGYLSGKELYPELKTRGLKDFTKEALEGKAASVYEHKKFDF